MTFGSEYNESSVEANPLDLGLIFFKSCSALALDKFRSSHNKLASSPSSLVAFSTALLLIPGSCSSGSILDCELNEKLEREEVNPMKNDYSGRNIPLTWSQEVASF